MRKEELVRKAIRDLGLMGKAEEWIRRASYVCEALSKIEELERYFDLNSLGEAVETLDSIRAWLESGLPLDEWIET